MYKPCDGQFLDIGFVQKVKNEAKQNSIFKMIGWNIKSTMLKAAIAALLWHKTIYFISNKPSIKLTGWH